MTIVADENIPHAAEALGSCGQVRTLPGRSITGRELSDSEALIVRSITLVDRGLLDGTPIRFVGTATIGADHIDLEYLRSAGIAFADAAGCNSLSVAEYVTAALLELYARGITEINGCRLGIVGAGRIGRLVAVKALALGMDVVEYDPPRAAIEPEFTSASADDLSNCDIITLHTPLTRQGEWPTLRMIDGAFLNSMKPGAILINAARGGVVDSGALSEALDVGRITTAVLDVWEGEPDVPERLIAGCGLATPHIAGYSFDGKLRGTEMMADALGKFASIPNQWRARDILPEEAGRIEISPTLSPLDAALTAVRSAYDIKLDDTNLRRLLGLSPEEKKQGFDALRKNYPQRREFPAHVVTGGSSAARTLLGDLGFTVA